MARPKKTAKAGKVQTAKTAGLAKEEKEAIAKRAPATGPSVKMRGQDRKEVGNVDHETVAASKEEDIESMVLDESNLSTDEKVRRLMQLYRMATKVWLVIGQYLLLNVFRNSLADARSKDPKKLNSFNEIANHRDLPEDLKGDTLRRYVFAAATMKELQGKGIPVELLDYSHFREISKLPDEVTREKVAKMVVESSATARDTEHLVKLEIERAQFARRRPDRDKSDKDKFSGLAVEIIRKLDDPEKRILSDEKLKALLLDPVQARAKFSFREQAKIYEKAERVLERKSDEKSNLDKCFASNQTNIEFLEELMDAFDGDADKTKKV